MCMQTLSFGAAQLATRVCVSGAFITNTSQEPK